MAEEPKKCPECGMVSTRDHGKALEPGSVTLVIDLKAITMEAEDGEFGDFSNGKYALPKAALVEKLEGIIKNVKQGKYD